MFFNLGMSAHIVCLNGEVKVPMRAGEMIVKPCLCLAVAVGILYALEPVTAWMKASEMNGFVQLAAKGGVICAAYGGMLWVVHEGKREKE